MTGRFVSRFVVALLLFAALAPVRAAEKSTTYKKDLYALLEHVDKKCMLLGEKKIKWKRVSAEAKRRLRDVDSDVEFYGLVSWVMDQLRDTHAYVGPRDKSLYEKLRDSKPKELQVPMSVMPGAFDLVLVSGVDEPRPKRGVQAGMILDTIDGKSAHDWFEARAKASFEAGGNSTIHRSRTEAYSFGVVLPEGGKVELGFKRLNLTDEDREKYLGLSARKRAAILKKPANWESTTIKVEASDCGPKELRGHGFPHWHPKDRVKLSGDTSYAKLPSGYGYVYLRHINGREQAAELKKAFTELADCPGLVVDMRWNGGGGGEGIVSACFPGKGKSEDHAKWTKPAAVLIGPRVMSSGDSVAFWLKNDYRHQLFGEHTTGASGRKDRFTLPSGFATVGFVSSHWKSRSLEGIGVAPNTRVLQDPVELVVGIDSVLAAAEKHLRKVAR